MNLILKNKLKGRVLYEDGDILYIALNNTLYISIDQGESLTKIYSFPSHSIIDKVGYLHPLLGRLLRKGLHHLSVDKDGTLGLLYNKRTAILSNGKLIYDESIVGSRPLSFEVVENEFVFGEYRSNPKRSEIGIYGLSLEKALNKKASMSGIRHIHGIYYDNFTSKIWITTGDNDDEATIYISDLNFKNIHKVIYGSQQTRAIKLLFTEDYVYFGSDAPEEINYLYRINRMTCRVEQLQQVGSSVFHGTKVGDWLFFSTAIEPSKANKTKYAEIWASPNGKDWKCIVRLKKDIWSSRYFQYGQIFFPSSTSSQTALWFSPFALQYSNNSYKIDITDIEEYFKFS